ncbi:hypothetical protein [Streptomyces tritici]|uniref:hypothetical protein n=1 Tax=Streptomyces tritici TaxID=2054410 RepID=UPI003AEFA81F
MVRVPAGARIRRLIEGLRRRAYDPARRLDEVTVPLEWLEETYGAEAAAERALSLSFVGSGVVAYLPAGAEEASAYYADAPRVPPHPPASAAEWEAAEAAIGRRLPALLRHVYTEVGDGGFGPDYGLHRLAQLVELYGRERKPWLRLVECGCATAWYVPLEDTAAAPLVVRYEDDGPGAERGITHATLPLDAWLDEWSRAAAVPRTR